MYEILMSHNKMLHNIRLHVLFRRIQQISPLVLDHS